jgi:HMG (high mobility group) box
MARTRKNNGLKNKKTRKQRGGRKLNGYMKFAQKTRPEILRANPSLRSDVVAVARKLGERWRSMSPAEKARY